MDYNSPNLQTVGGGNEVEKAKVGWVVLLVAMVTIAIAVAVGPDDVSEAESS